MGKSYYVPRSVKGETRLLYIFTIKSFITTAIFALIGAGFAYIGSLLGIKGYIPAIITTAIFGVIGYICGAVNIPDVPAMGKLRKAGGENIIDMLFRLLTFRNKKKIYIYNLKRGGK